MRIANLVLAVSLFIASNAGIYGQEHVAHHAGTATQAPITSPFEPGQGAFATIAEIVVLLEADPKTDWAHVNINALREHLVDMDEVTLRSAVTTTIEGNEIQFFVTGLGRTLAAIQRMIPAHAGELAKLSNWTIKAEVTGNGAILSISSNSNSEVAKIAALGFYGVMATGAHHQEHHLLIATGAGVH